MHRTVRTLCSLISVMASFTSVALRAEEGSVPVARWGRFPFVSVPKLAAPEHLSGDLSAEAWKQAAKLELRHPSTGAAPKLKTEALLFCTPEALYVGFRCEEPMPAKLATSGEIWMRDDVEIFLEPGESMIAKPYHQLMIDSNGAYTGARHHIYPLYMSQKAGVETWTPKLEVACAKQDASWTCEVRIPFAELKSAIAPDGLWRMNVGRSRPTRESDPAQASCWAPLGRSSFHTPQHFGYAVFESLNHAAAEKLREHAPTEADLEWLKGVDDALLAEIGTRVRELGSEDADVRTKAEEALKAMPGRRMGVLEVLTARIKNDTALREAKAIDEARLAVQRLSDCFIQWPYEHDEDKPAAEVAARIDIFEPRTLKDADGHALGYRLLKPKDYDPAKKYPLLLYLHGSGEVGNDNRRQMEDMYYFSESPLYEKYPCFLMLPQCPRGQTWADMRTTEGSLEIAKATCNYRLAPNPTYPMKLVLEAVDALQKEFPAIDAKRLYVAGSSMGGFGTWEAIARKPGLFAAAVPICGGGDETRAAEIAKTPLWFFHGALDKNVKVEGDRNMARELKKLGLEFKYTEYPEGGHSIHPLRTEPALLDWIFSQHKP